MKPNKSGLVSAQVIAKSRREIRQMHKLTSRIKKQPMTIEEAQKLVDQWIKTTGVRYFNELTNMTILTEEVGELARLMARTYGEQSFKESDKNRNLGDEMADVLWVLICLANQTGVDLTEALETNLKKKSIRDSTRHKENDKLKTKPPTPQLPI